MPVTNNTGPGTQSPWDTSGFAFSPNTNTLDRESMPSDKAEAARLKSAAVMAALKSGKPGEADRLMGENNVKQGQLVPPGPLKWLHRKFSGRKDDKGEAQDAVSVTSSDSSVMGKDAKS